MEYTKPWLSIDDQIEKLELRGALVEPREETARLLRAVGYYRLTGYLYPFRNSELYEDDQGKSRVRVLGDYRPGTSVAHAGEIIDFDRSLRMLVLDGLERVEVSLRVQVGHVLGRKSPFAHLNRDTFIPSFTAPVEESGVRTSQHLEWIRRVDDRRNSSDEAFVAHFREKYDNQMPIWALTEVLELGQLSRLYGGLQNTMATQIAQTYGVPSKRLMASWIASLNYVRNVAAHHARLYNRKLVVAPQRPRSGTVPLLDHLRDETSSKGVFGLYNVLAVTAYLLRSVDARSGWPQRLVELVNAFPQRGSFTAASMGFPKNWSARELWG